MRPFLLAIAALLAIAPAAHAQAVTTVFLDQPQDVMFGDGTTVTGTVRLDGVPAPGQPVELVGRPHPYRSEYDVIATGFTRADGTYKLRTKLERNYDLRVRSGAVTSVRRRTFIFPAFELDFRPRSVEEIIVIARYRVYFPVRLNRRTLFYVGRRGAKRAPVVARAAVERRRAGRYRAQVVVEIPASWKGRFQYAGCLPYSPGSGMGDPRSSCPRRFSF